MEIVLNGERRETPEGQSLRDLICSLELPTEAVVIERNGEIVDRFHYETVVLSQGDIVEIVRMVGGG